MSDSATNETKLWTREPARALVFAAVLPTVQEVGREHGYAVAVHGSLTRDLDLVAVPWTEEAADAETLVAALCARLGLMVFPDSRERGWMDKPHGRRVWTLKPDIHDPENDAWDDAGANLWGRGSSWIDLSVMPRITAPSE